MHNNNKIQSNLACLVISFFHRYFFFCNYMTGHNFQREDGKTKDQGCMVHSDNYG